MHTQPIFVAGIGTGVGKTLACAIITQALHADYWKPIQAGGTALETDTATVNQLVSNPNTNFFHEAYYLNTPVSPHYAAQLQNINLDIEVLTKLPPSQNRYLIIEPAGGIMTPATQTTTFLEYAEHLKAPTIVVSQNYLGSINHTLLTINALKQKKIPILGVIFNGETAPSTQQFIINYYNPLPILLQIPPILPKFLNADTVHQYAQIFYKNFKQHYPQL